MLFKVSLNPANNNAPPPCHLKLNLEGGAPSPSQSPSQDDETQGLSPGIVEIGNSEDWQGAPPLGSFFNLFLPVSSKCLGERLAPQSL